MKKETSTIVLVIFIISVVLVCFTSLVFDQMGWQKKTTSIMNVVDTSINFDKCEKYDGIWLDEFNECENIAQETCLSKGGYFNECGSACRHNPAASICTMQCVPVCEYAILNSKSGLIRVNFPRPNQVFEDNKIMILGSARGTWFFEGSFPIQIKDVNNTVFLESFATAKGEWMTEEFVPFEVELDISKLKVKGKLQLVMKKDNPSDIREFDDELIIPIEIK